MQLLKTFKAYCESNNIRYFLSNGTLLGAVKYQGFIPWDDDIDILIPRKDYDRLMKEYKDSDKLALYSFERNKKFLYPFAKLCDLSTIKEEKNVDNGVELGIDIDIFPLDFWGSSLRKAKKEAKKISRKMFFLNLTKLEEADSLFIIKRLIKAIMMFFCKQIGSQYFIERIIELSKKHTREQWQYAGCKAWCIYGNREIVSAGVFSDTVEVEFEGEKYAAPIGYDVYLRSLYGDYRQDPPLESQKTHHSFKAYRKQE